MSETQYDKSVRENPWLMRWLWIKMSIEEFFWRFHPDRNRWCRRCDSYIGHTNHEASTHRCNRKES